MLTGTATNAPKNFPNSPSVLLKKSEPAKPMNPKQWEAWIRYAAGGVVLPRPPKKNKIKYPPRQE